MIPVTKSFLPPINEYMEQVNRAYKNEWLTNRGELVLELEDKIKNYLQLSNYSILCLNNGTFPIQIALKLLAKGGEVITTPFSYVATTAAIVWENCTPVFVDIHPEYLTIDETKIESAITKKTTCILATHVFGNPCNVKVIEEIAVKHNLKVIYDAAHCFGVNYQGKSIFEYGDISTCSFHATKFFHTGEGGAIFCKDENLYNQIYYSHNFGHNGYEKFHGLGTNGKMSELSAAMGLSVFPYLIEILKYRKVIVDIYKQNLQNLIGIKIRENTEWNFSYFPVLFRDEESLLLVQQKLNEQNIFPRRYFYPSLHTLPYVQQQDMKISERISKNILCLPLFTSLELDSVKLIVSIIQNTLI